MIQFQNFAYIFKFFVWKNMSLHVSLKHVTFFLPQRRCQYGGDDEYRVNVRETGTNEQKQKASEETTERTQDIPSIPFVPSVMCHH